MQTTKWRVVATSTKPGQTEVVAWPREAENAAKKKRLDTDWHQIQGHHILTCRLRRREQGTLAPKGEVGPGGGWGFLLPVFRFRRRAGP